MALSGLAIETSPHNSSVTRWAPSASDSGAASANHKPGSAAYRPAASRATVWPASGRSVVCRTATVRAPTTMPGRARAIGAGSPSWFGNQASAR